MIKLLIAMIMVSTYALASGGAESGSTDIVQRTVNFLIFAGILYYLLAEPIKNYFSGRIKGIADDLEKVQQKLLEAKESKKVAQKKLADAKKFATDLMETSKKENKLLSEKILLQCEADLEIIEKSQNSLMELENRNMVNSTVEGLLKDILGDETGSLDKEAMAKIVMKKVA